MESPRSTSYPAIETESKLSVCKPTHDLASAVKIARSPLSPYATLSSANHALAEPSGTAPCIES